MLLSLKSLKPVILYYDYLHFCVKKQSLGMVFSLSVVSDSLRPNEL